MGWKGCKYHVSDSIIAMAIDEYERLKTTRLANTVSSDDFYC